MPPEFMHSQFLGTVKLMVDYFLGKRSAKQNKSLEILNRRISKIKFPSQILRKMPDLKTKLKSIEFENFLFYGIVALQDILPEKEFETFRILSYIIATLTARTISQQQINQVEGLINIFISNYTEIYPEEMHKYNIHMLTHLVEVVRRFGPLITNSAYQVEDWIGKLAKLVKSPKWVSEQVLNKSLMSASIVTTVLSNFEHHTPDFQKHVAGYFPILEENCPKPGTKKKYPLTEPEASLLNSHFNCTVDLHSKDIYQIDKVIFGKHYISTNDYSTKRNEQTNNQYIKTFAGNYYLIDNIIMIDDQVYFSCFQYLDPQNYKVIDDVYFDHIKTSKDLSIDHKLVLLSEIESPFSALFFKNKHIIFDLFNRHI